MQEFRNVKIQNETFRNRRSNESQSWKPFVFLFIFVVLFDISYILTSLNSPYAITKTAKYYPITYIYSADQFDLLLDISPITTSHRHLLINASFVRGKDTIPLLLPFSMNGSALLLKNDDEVSNSFVDEPKVLIEFEQGSKDSYNFTILNQNIRNCDYFQMNVSFIGNLLNIEGINVYIEYFNPITFKIINSFRLFLFVTSLFCLIHYINNCFKKEEFSILNKITIFIGIITVIVPNTVCILSNSLDAVRYIDSYIQLIFFVFYRIYIFSLTIIFYKKSEKSIIPIIGFGILYIIVYSLLEFSHDFYAQRISYAILQEKYIRETDPNPLFPFLTNKSAEYISDLFYTAFSIFVILVSLMTIISSDSNHKFTYCSYSILVIFSSAVTLLSKLYLKKIQLLEGTCIPFIVYFNTQHLVSTVILLIDNPISSSYFLLNQENDDENLTMFDD